jgi:hypothetical protein
MHCCYCSALNDAVHQKIHLNHARLQRGQGAAQSQEGMHAKGKDFLVGPVASEQERPALDKLFP